MKRCFVKLSSTQSQPELSKEKKGGTNLICFDDLTTSNNTVQQEGKQDQNTLFLCVVQCISFSALASNETSSPPMSNMIAESAGNSTGDDKLETDSAKAFVWTCVD